MYTINSISKNTNIKLSILQDYIDSGHTLFSLAVMCNDMKSVKSTDILSLEDDDISEALYFAVDSRHIDIVKYLIKYTKNVNYIYDKTNTPLLTAILNDDYNIAKLLLKYGADLYCVHDAVLFAADNGSFDIVDLLLTYTNKQYNLITYAAKHNRLDILKKYVKYCDNIDKLDDNDNTALVIFVANNNYKAVKLLLKYGASINVKQNIDPITMAHMYGHTDIYNLLKYMQ